MAKVWDKGKGLKLDPIIEAYSAGNDALLDAKLFKYELAASSAHATMLQKIGILNGEELTSVLAEMRRLYSEHGDTISMQTSDEDIHSRLENLLTSSVGTVGKKIHTGRSRNDQVMVVMRLYEKETLLNTILLYIDFLRDLISFAASQGDTILPGYTHTKQAMLGTVRMWVGAFVESGIDNLRGLFHALSLVDRNPLGTGSGFGVPVALDREMTTELLGFAETAENPMYVQNTRGKVEGIVIDAYWNIMNDFSRIATDLLMYNTDELLYVRTTPAITTGSSIMPQKRNLDVMELVRARTNVMLSYSTTVKNIATGVISGYNRDSQETKEPMMDATTLIQTTIAAVKVVFDNIEFNEEAIKKCLTPGIFATDVAFKAVAGGMAFRDAYKYAAEQIENIEVTDEVIRESIDERVSPGAPATLDLSRFNEILAEFAHNARARLDQMNELFGEMLSK